MRRIYIIYGDDAHGMTKALLDAADIASQIPSDASIALKPNLVVAKHPDLGATTHAGVVLGTIEYLKEHGKNDISIIESSWLGDNTQRAFRACGYDEIAKRYNVPFYDLKRDRVRTIDTAIGPMSVCERALDVDYLINLPVLKGHCQTLLTCALKNLKGCVPDSEKRRFHAKGLMEPIAALAAALRPSLTIVDSICGDLNFEEGGTPVRTNRMLLGTDPVQVDAYCCRLMGMDPSEVPYIELARRFGAGSMEIGEEDIVYLNSPTDAPVYPSESGLVAKLTGNVEQRSACSACFGNLVRALYRIREQYRTYDKMIVIGQEFKNVPFDGVGIGSCCNLAAVQVKGCPPSVDVIMKTLIEHM